MKKSFLFLLILFLPLVSSGQLKNEEPEWYLRTADGCSLFVKEYGRGADTLVILHGGWGAEHSYLLNAMKGLDDDYHLVFYDQRGSLRSACPDSLVSVQNHINDLEELRKELNLGKLNLVGHSVGTTLAMAYLDAHPDKVRGLVLVSVSAPRSPTTPEEKRLIEKQRQAKKAWFEREEVMSTLKEHGLDKPMDEMSDKELSYYYRIMFAGANLYDMDKWKLDKGGFAFFNSSAGRKAKESMPPDYNYMPALSRHNCPVWMLEGSHDFGPLTVEYHRLWSGKIPNIHLVEIDKAGHSIWIDQPVDFQKALKTALASSVGCNE
ncbi:alpha/beta fold hydrolase [Nafulsella turpanensis]|uniref:alpha/beta fold hydrolase n=1 Tax=Nafulsella turpanensis TaxID=1265690 RepID=UPI0003482EA3|nr:alpha/beta hydrolase [Nafulsella turpanensis]